MKLITIDLYLFLLEMGTELAKFFRSICNATMWCVGAIMAILYLIVVAIGTVKYAFHRTNFYLEIEKEAAHTQRKAVLAEEVTYRLPERRATVRINE